MHVCGEAVPRANARDLLVRRVDDHAFAFTGADVRDRPLPPREHGPVLEDLPAEVDRDVLRLLEPDELAVVVEDDRPSLAGPGERGHEQRPRDWGSTARGPSASEPGRTAPSRTSRRPPPARSPPRAAGTRARALRLRPLRGTRAGSASRGQILRISRGVRTARWSGRASPCTSASRLGKSGPARGGRRLNRRPRMNATAPRLSGKRITPPKMKKSGIA